MRNKIRTWLLVLKVFMFSSLVVPPTYGLHEFNIGAYVKTDLSVTNYSKAAGSVSLRDFLIPADIPTTGESKSPNFHMHAKESRIWFRGKQNIDGHNVSYQLEMDFLRSEQGNEKSTNSYSPRLRHVYAQIDCLLFGQTWSTFMNPSALPETLNFGAGSAGRIFDRQPQIRYIYNNFQFAVENARTFYVPYGVAGAVASSRSVIPDLVGKYNFEFADGGTNISIAALIRKLAFEMPAPFVDDSKWAGAVSLAGKIVLNQFSNFKFMLNYGKALGRYMVFEDAFVDSTNNLHIATQYGGVLAYQVNWNPTWRSTIAIEAANANNPASVINLGIAKEYQAAFFNIICQPIKNFDVGLEYIYGKRENENHLKGIVNRIQFSLKYSFPELFSFLKE